MNKNQLREDIFKYVTGEFSPVERKVFEEQIEKDSELQALVAQARALLVAEKSLAAKSYQAPSSFSDQVLAELDSSAAGFDGGYNKRLYMRLLAAIREWLVFGGWRRWATAGAVASVCLGVFAITSLIPFSKQRAAREISSDMPVAAPAAGETTLGMTESRKAKNLESELKAEIPLMGRKEEGLAAERLKATGQRSAQLPSELGASHSNDSLVARAEGSANGLADSSSNQPSGRLADKVAALDTELSSRGDSKDIIESFDNDSYELTLQNQVAGIHQDTKENSDHSAEAIKKMIARTAAHGNKQELNRSRSEPSQQNPLNERVALESKEILAKAGAGLLVPSSSTVNDGYFRRIEGGDRFAAYEENPRFQVKDNSVSTFSVDVDTASYTLARRNLQQGNLPSPEGVRIEEFLNYFTYNYPTTGDKPFAFSYEMAPAPLQPGRHLLKLNIASKAATTERKIWNLVFLVDVSGSMSDPDKLDLIKKAFPVLVKNLRENDRVSIVTYAGNAGVALEPTSSKEKILSAISTLGAGGSTNGSGGILAAYELAQKNFVKGGVNRVVLATDGDFNVGTTSKEELIKLIEQKRESGITLTTIGVGQGNLNDATLEQLADKGNGNYFYLDSFTEAFNVFEQKLAGAIEVVAKDVKLQVEFNPSVVREYRLIGYDNRKLRREDFNNDAIDAGEIGAGHEVTALYEVTLVGSTVPTPVDALRYGPTASPTAVVSEDKPQSPELGFLKIRFKKPEGSTSELLEFPLERSKIKHEASEASNDFRFASAVAYFATVLRDSQFKDNLAMKQIVELAQSSIGEDKEGSRREAVTLMKSVEALTTQPSPSPEPVD